MGKGARFSPGIAEKPVSKAESPRGTVSWFNDPRRMQSASSPEDGEQKRQCHQAVSPRQEQVRVSSQKKRNSFAVCKLNSWCTGSILQSKTRGFLCPSSCWSALHTPPRGWENQSRSVSEPLSSRHSSPGVPLPTSWIVFQTRDNILLWTRQLPATYEILVLLYQYHCLFSCISCKLIFIQQPTLPDIKHPTISKVWLSSFSISLFCSTKWEPIQLS